MRIFKFGGASVKDADGVRNLCEIITQFGGDSLVIVISAMGKTTNALEALVRRAYEGGEWKERYEALATYHSDICNELFAQVPEDVTNWLLQLKAALQTAEGSYEQFYDQIVPYGELLSTSIVYHQLSTQQSCVWLDARKCVKTNSLYTEANVEWELTEHYIARALPALLAQGPVITQGFIGSDASGKSTTLGREGSDFSGAIFAYCLQAESLTVWKDVPGLLNADPKRFPQAELFHELSFQEVTELTYYGAKVIHPKTIRPLAQRNIPLYVRSFVDPTGTGTKISESEKVGVKPCFVFKDKQLLFTLRVRDNSFVDESKLVRVFQALDQANVKINLMHSSALTFTFCMDYSAVKLEKLQSSLTEEFHVLYNEGLHLATIKNYTPESFELLPPLGEVILEQKTRNNFQVLYRPTESDEE
ncbi:aspartate kinase [Marinoscillum furvescens]|uniref:Aspartokinase n=1 Tax=Marinoscillum furvescens DSM 4134 TaxID=1122208 RepID=A0A3D9LH64_MARFU|nr:aspartate kinase [Marinoscillum furvescens]REE05741.1 aspartate kinase [Marinoscillum furvescens DSM 4134]